MSEIKLKFGERIREVRKNVGCSQKEFCVMLDIPQSTLSAYETDRMQPTVASLANIAIKFNVSLDWLCGIEKNSEQNVNYPSELSDDLKAALDDAEKLLKELAARRQSENKLRKTTHKKGRGDK